MKVDAVCRKNGDWFRKDESIEFNLAWCYFHKSYEDSKLARNF